MSKDNNLGSKAEILNHGHAPPAIGWSKPADDQATPTSVQLLLYRDECIRLHHEVSRLHQYVGRLIEINEQLLQDHQQVMCQRDQAISTCDNHCEKLQQTELEVAQLRRRNKQLQAGEDALEHHKWRRAMCAKTQEFGRGPRNMS